MPFWKNLGGNNRPHSADKPKSFESFDEYHRRGSPTFYDAKENPSVTDNLTVTSPTGDSHARSDAKQQTRNDEYTVGGEEMEMKKSMGGYFEHRLVVSSGQTRSTPVSPGQGGHGTGDIHAAIAMLQSLKKTATADDLNTLKDAMRELGISEEDAVAPQRRVSEKTVVENPLIRRRSIFASPGVATRKVSPRVLKKTPPGSKSAKGEYQRSDLEKSSALDKLINESKGGVPNRPMTPSEFEYPNIGAHEFGTLRITNGTASPEPSIFAGKSWQRPTTVQVTEYFTASEGAPSSSGADESNQDYSCETSDAPSIRNDEHEDNDKTLKSTPTPVEQPLNELIINRIRNLSPPDSPSSPLGPRRMPLIRRHTDESVLSETSLTPKHPVGFTQLYQTEASSNPFLPGGGEAPSVILDRELQAAAERGIMRARDETRTPALPDDTESIYSEHPKVPSILRMPTCREDALERLNGDSFYARASQRSVSNNSSVYPAQATARNSIREAKISRSDTARNERWSTTDSGYSSTTSSYHPATQSQEPRLPQVEQWHNAQEQRNPQNDPWQDTLERRMLQNDYRHHGQQRQQPQNVQRNVQQRSFPNHYQWQNKPLPPVSALNTSQPGSHLHSGTGNYYSAQPSPTKERQMYSLPYKSASSGDLQKTAPLHTFASAPSSSPTTPNKTENRKQQGTNKLQKKRPAPGRGKSAPVVVSASSPSGVPRVPSVLETMHHDRINKNPGMDSLKHTYDSVSSSEPKTKGLTPTLPNVEIRFPSPNPESASHPMGNRGRKISWRRSSNPGAPSYGLFGRRNKERQIFNEPSLEHYGDDDFGVSDFGTVTESLGSSPYDIAYGPHRKAQRSQDPSKTSHPHQMTHNPVRRKLMMDEKAASRFAMQRSRDRLANFDAHIRDQQMNEGRAFGSRPRPMSMYADAPPMPALPSQRPGKMQRPKSYQSAIGMPCDQFTAAGEQENQDEGDSAIATADDVEENSVWASHAKRWRRRRKSAGDGLQPHWEYEQVQKALRQRAASQSTPTAPPQEKPQLRLDSDIPTPTMGISFSPASATSAKSPLKPSPSPSLLVPKSSSAKSTSTPATIATRTPSTTSSRNITPTRKPLPANARLSVVSPTPSTSSVLAKAAMFQAKEDERPSRPPSPEKNAEDEREREREWMWSRTQVWSTPTRLAAGSTWEA